MAGDVVEDLTETESSLSRFVVAAFAVVDAVVVVDVDVRDSVGIFVVTAVCGLVNDEDQLESHLYCNDCDGLEVILKHPAPSCSKCGRFLLASHLRNPFLGCCCCCCCCRTTRR